MEEETAFVNITFKKSIFHFGELPKIEKLQEKNELRPFTLDNTNFFIYHFTLDEKWELHFSRDSEKRCCLCENSPKMKKCNINFLRENYELIDHLLEGDEVHYDGGCLISLFMQEFYFILSFFVGFGLTKYKCNQAKQVYFMQIYKKSFFSVFFFIRALRLWKILLNTQKFSFFSKKENLARMITAFSSRQRISFE